MVNLLDLYCGGMFKEPIDRNLPVSSSLVYSTMLLDLGRGFRTNDHHYGSYVHLPLYPICIEMLHNSMRSPMEIVELLQ